MNGKFNISAGLLTMGLFMFYGFLLVYLRDFAPGKEDWIASYSTGKHFESRLAHVHGTLFSILNIVIGYLLIQFNAKIKNVKIVSWLALGGLLMPLGILGEVYLGLSPVFVFLGALSMTFSVFMLGFSFIKLKNE